MREDRPVSPDSTDVAAPISVPQNLFDDTDPSMTPPTDPPPPPSGSAADSSTGASGATSAADATTVTIAAPAESSTGTIPDADGPSADAGPSDDDPFSPSQLDLTPEDPGRRKLLMFIVIGSVAAILLLIVALVLVLQSSNSSDTASSGSSSQATLTLTPSGTVNPGTVVTAKVTLVSTSSFKVAVILLDGAPVAQASLPTDPLTFTPSPGKHTAVAKVTLTTSEEVTSPAVEINVTTTSGSSAPTSVAGPATSAAGPASTATTAAPTTTAAPAGPLQANGLSADGAKPLKFGDPVSAAATTFPGEQAGNTCSAIAPTYTGGKNFTFFGFPGGKFSYYLTQDPSLSTVEGAKVGMAADDVKKLYPELESKTNSAGIPLLIKKSADGKSEMVFYIADNKVLFVAGSIGDAAESKQC